MIDPGASPISLDDGALSANTASKASFIARMALLAFVAFCALFFELGRSDVESDNEGQRVTPPAEMLRSGDYTIPTINGVPYLAKPPLLYWTIAGLYKATGRVSESVARVPSALCGVCLVLAAYALCRRSLGEWPAFLLAFILLSSPFFLIHARVAELDMPLALFTFLAIITSFRAWEPERTPTQRAVLATLSGLCLGAAVMLKGPPPVMFLATAFLAHELISGADPARASRMGLTVTVAAIAADLVIPLLLAIFGADAPAGLIVFTGGWIFAAWRFRGEGFWRNLGLFAVACAIACALAAPWALAVMSRQGWPFIQSLLHNQVVERTYLASRINGGWLLFYPISLAAILLPWSLLLPLAFSREAWPKMPVYCRFCTVFAWIAIGLFSFVAGKEKEYILPAIPFLLVGPAWLLAESAMGRDSAWVKNWFARWEKGVLILVGVVLCLGPFYFSATEQRMVLAIECFGIAILGVIAALLLKGSPTRKLARICVLTLLAAVMGLTGKSFHFDGTDKSPAPLARICRELMDRGAVIETAPRLQPQVMFLYPPLSFYLGRNIPMEADMETVARKLREQPNYYYLAQEKLLERLPKDLDVGPVRTFFGPATRKDYLLIGATSIPADLPGLADALKVYGPPKDIKR